MFQRKSERERGIKEREMSLAIVERQAQAQVQRPVAGCVGVLFLHLLDWNKRLAQKTKKRFALRSLLPPLLKRCPKPSSPCPHPSPLPQLVLLFSFLIRLILSHFFGPEKCSNFKYAHKLHRKWLSLPTKQKRISNVTVLCTFLLQMRKFRSVIFVFRRN